MRISHRLLLSGMLAIPLIGSSLSLTTIGQEPTRGEGQEQGRGPGGGGGRWQGGRGGPGGGMMGGMGAILGMQEVQADLKLDEDQKQALRTMREEMMKNMFDGRGPGGRGPGGDGAGRGTPPSEEQMAEMRAKMKKMRSEIETKIADILDPDQNSRLLGLMIQREGGRALTSTILTSALELTSDQLAALDAAESASMKERATAMREAMAGGAQGGGWMKMREQMESMNKKLEESLLAVLTSEQRTEFDALKGEKFEFPEFEAGGPGGGRSGRPGGRGERPGSSQ